MNDSRTATQFREGDRVSLRDGRLATVRYCGQVMFGPTGIWIGLELDSATGKNNGTVDGISYFTCKDKYGLFVQADRLTLLRAAPHRPYVGPPMTPVAMKTNETVPPFQVGEATNRILEMSQAFSVPTTKTTTTTQTSVVGEDENKTPVRMVQPVTPKKNILESFSGPSGDNVMGTAIKANIGGTPGSNALSRELLRRQDEVNMLRKQVEPLLGQAKRLALSGGPTEHLKVIVDRISGSLEQYDKVVSRYERQLQKLITHMDKKRALHEASQEEAEKSLGHRLGLKEKEVEDLKGRLAAAETQIRLLRKEYEQAQRNVSTRVSIEEDLAAENGQLRAELERLRAEQSISNKSDSHATSTSAGRDEQLEMLTAALEATRQENQELKRQRELQSHMNNPISGTNTTKVATSTTGIEDSRLTEVLRAKDRQEAYFTELIETLKLDHSRASDTLNAALSQAKADLEETRSQLEEQRTCALRYSQAIDQTSDKCYQENRQLLDQLERAQAELSERDGKMRELIEAAEKLRADREDRDQQISRLEQKLVDLSASMARSNSTRNGSEQHELVEARKQIRTLEQTILEMSEHQQDKEMTGRLQSLQRQLAQVEYEKGQIETSLRRERERASRLSNVNAQPPTGHAGLPTNNARATQIKAELQNLRPTIPRFIDRLSSLFSAPPKDDNNAPLKPDHPQPLNMEAVNRAYADIKGSFDGLEAARQKALNLVANVAIPNGLDDGGEIGTPTMNRRARPVS